MGTPGTEQVYVGVFIHLFIKSNIITEFVIRFVACVMKSTKSDMHPSSGIISIPLLRRPASPEPLAVVVAR